MMVQVVVGAVLAILVSSCVVLGQADTTPAESELLVVTIATQENDGFRQFMRSAKKYGLDVKVFGMGEEWKGGDMESVGGGHKVNMLKEGLKQYRNRQDLILMFVDSYDVIITAGKEELLKKFAKFDARVVFAAENTCWPDRSLADKYPGVKASEKRYLNSGGFIGYAPEVYEMVTNQAIKDQEDDQLYYTEIFLNRALRHEWGIKLDVRAEIFQNLNHALGEIMVKYKGEHSYMYNVKTGTSPLVIHGNGPIKPEFFRLANYLADGWTTESGCKSCKEDLFDLASLEESDYPKVMMALFVEYPTPFVREFLQRAAQIDYPKSKMQVYIHSNVELHVGEVTKFVEEYEHQYARLVVSQPEKRVSERTARTWALEECIRTNCDYLLTLDSVVQLTNPSILTDLITQNRSIVAPMLKRPGKLWSNFWGALGADGFYARSEDYMDIIEMKRIGLWNVPYVGSALLIQGRRLPELKGAYGFNQQLDPDMSFCQAARTKMVFMYVSNQEYYGHLVNADNFDTTHLNNELFDIFNNPHDWRMRYIHKDYGVALKPDAVIEQPCPDVFWFPIVTETFCDEFVAEFENYGQWSGGKNNDPRLAGGYENVPTVDIHMNQVGLEQQWLKFLQDYVRPLQEKVFTGYFHNPPNAHMNFIVRYKPDEQPFLRPHHDASTYTINIALNHPGIDFEGGGCRFIRYNCSITSPRKGWMFMHPGRLTHYHEGLTTTAGTRYIMISFVDP